MVPGESMPQFLLGSGKSAGSFFAMPRVGVNKRNMLILPVQDENLKNLMMSWYYAGYYTGLYEGQQRASSAEQKRS